MTLVGYFGMGELTLSLSFGFEDFYYSKSFLLCEFIITLYNEN